MVKLLFVCLGNICRSPAAEGIAKSIIESKKLSDKISVDSAGIGNWHVGELPNIQMRKAAKLRGLVLDGRARQFSKKDLDEFDYVLAMDSDNLNDILLQGKQPYKSKVILITDLVENSPYKKSGVPDPYGLGDDRFHLVLDVLSEACEILIEKVIKENNI